MEGLPAIEDFQWDLGNADKNWQTHKVSNKECEEIFFNEPLLFFEDFSHSKKEDRIIACGITKNGRKLTVIFTARNGFTRVISARDQSRKERRFYEKTSDKENS
ncbi:MAG: BrnT family toxin [candidate division WWE3 bacterium]|nr:BrnT family toxin [candidate division WWE3 bacterium]